MQIFQSGIRIFRWTLKKLIYWVILPLCILFVLSIAAATAFCFLKSEFVSDYITQELRHQTQLPWKIRGTVLPTLHPSLGLVAQDVSLHAVSIPQEIDGIKAPPLLRVSKVRITLDLEALANLTFSIRHIWINSPHITLAYGLSGKPLWIPLVPPIPQEVTANSKTRQLPRFFYVADDKSCPITFLPPTEQAAPNTAIGIPANNGTATNNTIRVAASANQTSRTDEIIQSSPPAKDPFEKVKQEIDVALDHVRNSINATYLPSLRMVNGTVDYLASDNTPFMTAYNATMRFSRRTEEPLLTFSSMFNAPTLNMHSNIEVTAHPGDGTSLLTGVIKGTAHMTPPHQAPIHATLEAPFELKDTSYEVLLPKSQIRAEGDSLDIALTTNLLDYSSKGKLTIYSLSLPRWFKFGRNLPPNIQHALHTIQGETDVLLTTTGVWGTNLRATAGGRQLNGTITVADFSQPAIHVDLSSPEIDVDTLIPVLSADKPAPPELPELSFPFNPLVPFEESTTSDKNDLPDVGYRVRIDVAKTRVHSIDAGAVNVIISPQLNDICRVAFSGSHVLGGELTGYLDIDRELVNMRFKTQKVSLAGLPENKNSNEKFAGLLTSTVNIDIPVNKGAWSKVWKLAATGEIAKAEVRGGSSTPWYLRSQLCSIHGTGDIHTARAQGIRIDGNWNIGLNHFSNSWNPKANETINGQFKGTLAWPKGNTSSTKQSGGINHVYGVITAKGSCAAPLGKHLVPLTGTLAAKLDWLIPDGNVTLDELSFEGFNSTVNGKLHILMQPKETLVTAAVKYKIAPRVLLKAWDFLPSSVQVPQLATGSADVRSDATTLTFSNLKAQLDATPIEGTVTYTSGIPKPPKWSGASLTKQAMGNTKFSTSISETDNPNSFFQNRTPALMEAAKKVEQQNSRSNKKQAVTTSHVTPAASMAAQGLWTMRLHGKFFNLDNFIIPQTPEEQKQPPSKKPWNLRPFAGLNIDAILQFDELKFQKLSFKTSVLDLKLIQDIFALRWNANNFYSGKATLVAEGTLVLPSRIQLATGLVSLSNFMLDKAFYDYNKDTSFGGKCTINTAVSGSMSNNAEVAAALSGSWDSSITDGMYPAFLGSETSGLRNTFSYATASGVIQSGVAKWDNFKLHGIMVDMFGGGIVDFVKKHLDITISVTLAKVPTVPVRFSGAFDSPSMNVRGAHIVFHTAQAAGSTVLDVFLGILSLPGRAISGVGDLLDSSDSSDKNSQQKSSRKKK